jgi:hypothetical protein
MGEVHWPSGSDGGLVVDVPQELRAPRDTCSWWLGQGRDQLAVAGDVGLEVDGWDS